MLFEDYIGCLEIRGRCNLVGKLIRGNDTCCFSTEQYIELHSKEGALLPPPREDFPPIPSHIAKLQILSTKLVVEVKPGIWALTE